MNFVFPPSPQPRLAIEGQEERFPIRRIFCVGRNYAAHTREMGGDPLKEPPFFFSKPADAAVASGTEIPYPPLTHDLQYEIELVVAIGNGGATIAPKDAGHHIFGYAAGVDLTRRDLQSKARAAGLPWDWSKAFDYSAPIGPLRRATNEVPLMSGAIWLSVNGVERQRDDLAAMIWPVADIIAFASQSVRLEAGDLIMTGTPAGVGPLQIGDSVEGGVEGVGTVHFKLGAISAINAKRE